MLAISKRYRVDHVNLESALGPELLKHGNITRAPMAKAMVVADEQA